mmetsp:Transcript_20975/g.58184  ORF Transcript_20975/g.58184 Transcript_20975/m.58184 type:complete len:229 (+) Transcript_20975:995-1681(+)
MLCGSLRGLSTPQSAELPLSCTDSSDWKRSIILTRAWQAQAMEVDRFLSFLRCFFVRVTREFCPSAPLSNGSSSGGSTPSTPDRAPAPSSGSRLRSFRRDIAIAPGSSTLSNSAHMTAIMRLAHSELITITTMSRPPSLAMASGPEGCSDSRISLRRTSGLSAGLLRSTFRRVWASALRAAPGFRSSGVGDGGVARASGGISAAARTSVRVPPVARAASMALRRRPSR